MITAYNQSHPCDDALWGLWCLLDQVALCLDCTVGVQGPNELSCCRFTHGDVACRRQPCKQHVMCVKMQNALLAKPKLPSTR